MQINTDIMKAIAGHLTQTIREQWTDMLQLFKSTAKQTEAPAVQAGQAEAVLELRIRMEAWPQNEGLCIRTRSQSFTMGNAPEFDICLNPKYEQTGDVYCAVFFDEKRSAFIAVQATGSFNIPIKDRSDPYRPGDWSLFVSGNRFETVARETVMIPVSDKQNSEYVLFNIGGAYFFEARAYIDSAPEQDEEGVDLV